MKKITAAFFLLLAFFFTFSDVKAAKKFAQKAQTSKRSSGTRSSSIPSSVRYRSDKLGLYLSFKNFSGIDSASYSFTYTSNGIQQGIGGSISENNNPLQERELLFGTCSTSVCTYHSNLQNANLIITAKYKNGTTSSKRYRIKTYR